MALQIYALSKQKFDREFIFFDFYQKLMSQRIFNRILNNQLRTKRIGFSFPQNFILSIISLFYIAKAFLSSVKKLHYMVDTSSQVDIRSFQIQDIVGADFMPIFHSPIRSVSILSFIKKKHKGIYLTPLVDLIFFLAKPFFAFRRVSYPKYKDDSDYALVFLNVCKSIFFVLNISKIVCIDDPRYSAGIIAAARFYGIKVLGYQHGKFNNYSMGLKVLPFDYYICWNEYYRKMYRSFWPNFKNCNIFTCGMIKVYNKTKAIPFAERKKNILWLEEDRVPFNQYLVHIDRLLKNGFNIIVRFKSRSAKRQYIVDSYKIDHVSTLGKSIEFHKIGYVIGTHSTALIESTLYNAIPISFIPYNDYARDLFDAQLIHKFSTYDDLVKFLAQKSPQLSKGFLKSFDASKTKYFIKKHEFI
jgi:hypothetical protein